MRGVEYCRIGWLATFLATAFAQTACAQAAESSTPGPSATDGGQPRSHGDQIRAALSLSTVPRDAPLLPTEDSADREGLSVLGRRELGPLVLTPTWTAARTEGNRQGSTDERTDVTSPGLRLDMPWGKANALSLRYGASFVKERQYLTETDTQAQSLSAEAQLRVRDTLTLRLANDLSKLAWHDPEADPPYRYAYGDSNANLDWQVSSKWTLGAELQQRSKGATNGEEAPVLTTTIGIDSAYKLTGKLSLLSGAAVTGDRLADRLAFQTAPEDLTKTGAIGLGFQPNRRVRTELTYGFGWRQSRLPTQETLESSLKLSLSIGF